MRGPKHRGPLVINFLPSLIMMQLVECPESKGTTSNGLSFYIDSGRASGVCLTPAFFVYVSVMYRTGVVAVCDRAGLRRAVASVIERVTSLQGECFALFYDLYDLRRRHVLTGKDVEEPRPKKARVVVERRFERDEVARQISVASSELDLKVDQTVTGLGTCLALQAIFYGTAGMRGDVFFRDRLCQRENLAAGRNVNTRGLFLYGGDEIDYLN